jgi:hypothetical protein
MCDVARNYVSCSNSVQLVPLYPIVISILFHHYKELEDAFLKLNGYDKVNDERQEEY